MFHTFTATLGTNDYQLASTSYGPDVSTNFPIGWYAEDFDFLGDRLNAITGTNYQQGVDSDLDQPNGRLCVTPEFPGGTCAYFVPIDASGVPAFPYSIGRYWYGTNTGGRVVKDNITEAVTTYFVGGPDLQEVMSAPAANPGSGSITLTWSSVEGGTYKLEFTGDLAINPWATLATLPATSNAVQTMATNAGAMSNTTKRFYRISRSGLAPYDP